MQAGATEHIHPPVVEDTTPGVPCAGRRIALDEALWKALQASHRERVRRWTANHRDRAARAQAHPVEDFLFSYYSYRPAWLERWHPGPDVALAGEEATTFLRWEEYRATPDGVALDVAALPDRRRDFVLWLRDFLRAQLQRPAFYGCFGLHEWAMVYRLDPADIRHAAWPLRLPPGEIARIVEAGPVCCTHFDAFRFFTAAARPLNRHQPTRETTPVLEQRGCLHAGMDLYKWAYKLAPYSPSSLVADCFALARDIRVMDMRASPYDLQALGYEPVAIETAEGRATYEREQRAFTARADPLRDRLLALCNRLLAG